MIAGKPRQYTPLHGPIFSEPWHRPPPTVAPSCRRCLPSKPAQQRCTRLAIRRRPPRYNRTPRADRLSRPLRRGADQAQLRHLPSRRPDQPRTRRRHHPFRRRPHPPAPPPHRCTLPLPEYTQPTTCRPPAPTSHLPHQAGRHFRLRHEPPLSGARRLQATLAKPLSLDLVAEAAEDIRGALNAGAANVQIDFTEVQALPQTRPLRRPPATDFIALNNQVAGPPSPPGNNASASASTSAPVAITIPRTAPDIEYASLHTLTSSSLQRRTLLSPNGQRARSPAASSTSSRTISSPTTLSSSVSSTQFRRRSKPPPQVRSSYPRSRPLSSPSLNSAATDDCGFSPFADDTSTAREIAFSKIRARGEGTVLASP